MMVKFCEPGYTVIKLNMFLFGDFSHDNMDNIYARVAHGYILCS